MTASKKMLCNKIPMCHTRSQWKGNFASFSYFSCSKFLFIYFLLYFFSLSLSLFITARVPIYFLMTRSMWSCTVICGEHARNRKLFHKLFIQKNISMSMLLFDFSFQTTSHCLFNHPISLLYCTLLSSENFSWK